MEINETDLEQKIENAVVWIKALASNRFPKAKYKLHRGGASCCLGVADDLLNLNAGRGNDDVDLSPDMCNQFGLIPSRMPRLMSFNDGVSACAYKGQEAEPAIPHSEIAAELIKYPDWYFYRDVADGIKEYFYTGEK